MEYHETQHQQGVTPPWPLREAPSSLLAGVLSRLNQSERYIAAQRSPQALLNALEHPQWEIRAAAVQAVEKLGPQAALDPLLGVLQDEHRLVRAAAVHALGSLAEQTPEQQIPVEQVLLVLRDEAWEVREMAVLTLGKLHHSLAEPLLQVALQDSNSCVREAARFTLKRREGVSPYTNDEGQRQSIVPTGRLQVKQVLLHLWLVFSRQLFLLNRSIWLITALAMAIACILTFVLHADAGWSLTAAALCASTLGAAHISGSENDAGMEIALATPTSIRTLLLARLAMMLSYNVGLAMLTSTVVVLVQGGGLWGLIHLWLGPALLFASFSLACPSCWVPYPPRCSRSSARHRKCSRLNEQCLSYDRWTSIRVCGSSIPCFPL